ncbi:hypothetical protein HMPREF3038_01023 [Akkermansia sp. KLE1797]|nr:hypothetical protein HMPREF3038_01023 [Akkermansia sp. KLE1797]KXU52890.1 hypothetical protein HMPREF3039_02949 [Akkermansia sp. KLE1798]KZA05407.1 hypothetical protein HMPREF1326_00901 [Akkermansia sp. KLE1605]
MNSGLKIRYGAAKLPIYQNQPSCLFILIKITPWGIPFADQIRPGKSPFEDVQHLGNQRLIL